AFGREADTPELRRLRVRIEDKGSIVAFHWRGAPDEEVARAAIDAIAARAEQGGLRTHWGRKVLEVRPPVRMDKGAGIVAFLSDMDLDAAVYVGDDATDRDAFRGLGELHAADRLRYALCVCVRSDEGPSELAEEADLVVDGPDGVRTLLESLLATGDDDALGRMRFTDFLKATVMTSAAAATLLAAVTVAAAGPHDDPLLVPFAAGWWLLAALMG